MIFFCKVILILLGSLLFFGNIFENIIIENLERVVCYCYRKIGFVFKSFLEIGEKYSISKGFCF